MNGTAMIAASRNRARDVVRAAALVRVVIGPVQLTQLQPSG